MRNKCGIYINEFSDELGHLQRYSEHFVLFLCANMFLIERYDFIRNFFCTTELPVSDTFSGNMYRLAALSKLYEAQRKSSFIGNAELEAIVRMLEKAEEKFKKSEWGLGLTYNLLGRIHL